MELMVKFPFYYFKTKFEGSQPESMKKIPTYATSTEITRLLKK